MWYVVASSPVDFDQFITEGDADRMPRHLLLAVADDLNGELVNPDPTEVRWIDRLLARVYGMPHHWAAARGLAARLVDGDGVMSTGSDSGLAVAFAAAVRRRKVALCLAFAEPMKPRTVALGWLAALLFRKRLAIMVTRDEQRDEVRRSYGRLVSSVTSIGYTTDCDFFRPPTQARPRRETMLVAGSGTEQRDYDTLATALEGLDAEAKVCFVSPNFTDRTRYRVPDPVPPTMEFRHYSFADLRSLYQEADALVIPLLTDRSVAGLTALFEAIACECPVVMTTSPGMIQGMVDDDLILGVGAGSPSDIRQALKEIGADPEAAADRARRARAHLLRHHSSEEFLRRLTAALAPLRGVGHR